MQNQAKREFEWEQWPGRTEPDDRMRGRLRSLFAPSDGEDEVTALIAERGRELEQRSVQLRAAVDELEQRETHARELHAHVEQILRDGAAELDLRQAELNARAFALDGREALIAEREAAVEGRRRELGAVELQRASVERREAAVRLQEEQLERQSVELDERERRFEEPGSSPAQPTARDDEYVALLAGDRYQLKTLSGPPPLEGAAVEIDGKLHRCTRVTSSPLPGDDRRCALLEPVSGFTSDT